MGTIIEKVIIKDTRDTQQGVMKIINFIYYDEVLEVRVGSNKYEDLSLDIGKEICKFYQIILKF